MTWMTLGFGHFFANKYEVLIKCRNSPHHFHFSTKIGPKSISKLTLATGSWNSKSPNLNQIPEKYPNTYDFWHFLAWVGIILMKIDRPFWMIASTLTPMSFCIWSKKSWRVQSSLDTTRTLSHWQSLRFPTFLELGSLFDLIILKPAISDNHQSLLQFKPCWSFWHSCNTNSVVKWAVVKWHRGCFRALKVRKNWLGCLLLISHYFFQNCFIFFKGGLISESFLPWSSPQKNVPK